jgi:hypothetical protein
MSPHFYLHNAMLCLVDVLYQSYGALYVDAQRERQSFAKSGLHLCVKKFGVIKRDTKIIVSGREHDSKIVLRSSCC